MPRPNMTAALFQKGQKKYAFNNPTLSPPEIYRTGRELPEAADKNGRFRIIQKNLRIHGKFP